MYAIVRNLVDGELSALLVKGNKPGMSALCLFTSEDLAQQYIDDAAISDEWRIKALNEETFVACLASSQRSGAKAAFVDRNAATGKFENLIDIASTLAQQ